MNRRVYLIERLGMHYIYRVRYYEERSRLLQALGFQRWSKRRLAFKQTISCGPGGVHRRRNYPEFDSYTKANQWRQQLEARDAVLGSRLDNEWKDVHQ